MKNTPNSYDQSLSVISKAGKTKVALEASKLNSQQEDYIMHLDAEIEKLAKSIYNERISKDYAIRKIKSRTFIEIFCLFVFKILPLIKCIRPGEQCQKHSADSMNHVF